MIAKVQGIPSLGQLVKVAGVLGASALAVAAGAGLSGLLVATRRSSLRPTTVWFVALGAVAVMLFAVLYPMAASGQFGGGSDRDDALNDALHLLLAGHYPYAALTYLGNPPTPMPGALLLALPFYLLGNAALQNLIWVSAFFFWCRSRFQRPALAWTAGLIVIILAPQALDDFVVGGDYLVNALYVVMATDWCVRSQSSEHLWLRSATAIMLAIAVSSRPIYAVALVLVAGHVWQVKGAARCALFTALAGVVIVGLTLPFYLYDPASFPTAHLFGKLNTQPSAMLFKIALPVLGLLVASLAFWWRLAVDHPLDLLGLSLATMLYPPFVSEALSGQPIQTWIWTASYTLPVTVLGSIAVLQRFERDLSRQVADAQS
jgi:hypothetical protein